MKMKKLIVGCMCAVVAASLSAETIVTALGDLELTDKVPAKAKVLKRNPMAARLAERFDAKARVFPTVTVGTLAAYRTEIEGLGYRRIAVDLTNTGTAPVRVERFELLKGFTPGGVGERVGKTDGAVAVFPACHTFVGVENPLAKVTVDQGKVTAVLERGLEIKPNEHWTVSYVIGTYRDGQLRRDFHAYLNRERAHPYRVLPHYNSWYDLNINRNDSPWEKRMNEAEALGVMVKFREELSKRGVFINSYLWDDGWDDWNSLWDFHPGFPNGFKKLADEAHKNKGASIGAWMSPCGGYGRSNAGRVRYAKEKGFLPQNQNLMRLSIPSYYKAFRDQVLKMIADYDMNLFKFDRMGCGHDCEGASKEHAADMDAIVRLIGEMRFAKPDVFVNATVGTWASPFWVMYADSIWRGGGDFGMAGAGTPRQKWLTYRDNVIHDRFVVRSPLYPLNSMMMHGIIVNRGGPPNVMDVSDSTQSTQDFADEVWMGVACGTGLQEYYITPKLMHPKWWDILADGVKWLKDNEKVLQDVHWVGGDPCFGREAAEGANPPGEVYGYASWWSQPAIVAKKGCEARAASTKGIVILRNPSDKPQTLKTTLAKLFELEGLAQEKKPVKGRKIVYSHDAQVPQPKRFDEPIEFSFGPFGVALVEF